MALDPYRDFRFKVDIQGVVAGHFTRVSGMSVDVQAIEYREGGGPAHVRKLPGRVSYGDVSLSYGVGTSAELWDWLTRTVNGEISRRNVSIIILDVDGQSERSRFNLNQSWVRSASFTPLDSLSNQVLIETMVLAVESIERA